MEPGEGGTYSSVNLLYGAHTGQEGHMKAGGKGTCLFMGHIQLTQHLIWGTQWSELL